MLAENQEKVTICQKRGANEVTIEVATSALDVHIAHDDKQGSCDQEFKICTFEPIMITITSPEPVTVPIQLTEIGQDLNFDTDDPPGVFWSATDLEGNIIIRDGPDHHFHLTWGPYNFSEPGNYYMVFNHPFAGTTYPIIHINFACGFDAPEP